MKKISLPNINIVQGVLFSVVGILVAAVVILAGMSRNTVTEYRDGGSYAPATDVSVTENDALREYRFTLGEIGHADTLSFFVNHHEATVFIGDECVYTMTPETNDCFVTGGGTWIQIPLYADDAGKDVRVILHPLYEDYRIDTPNFLIGSEIEIYRITLYRTVPALILSLCVVFAGILLLCLAVYHSAKKMRGGRLYALGLMAFSAGLWRISYDRVAYLLFTDYAVLAYTVSILSLMTMALAMLNALDVDENGKKIIRFVSLLYCTTYAVLLALQATGAADLRQTLPIVHATIFVSAASFFVAGILRLRRPRGERDNRNRFGWVIGCGVIIDLLLYYFSSSSPSLIFTLSAILCYSILEGTQLIFAWARQKNALEEMETQLTLSRTATMMSQIRSHFVFNLLNAISGMCKYDPELADETVVRFARYLRNNINIMESDKPIPFATDLRQTEDYVALEQVRFGDKIRFVTDIETDAFVIPPLILQPVVENAIKHGVSRKQGNGTITLRVRDAGETIVITVTDDGVGFDLTELDKEQSVGIRNIRFRLEHLAHGTLSIESEIDRGTTVTITIPKEDSSCI